MQTLRWKQVGWNSWRGFVSLAPGEGETGFGQAAHADVQREQRSGQWLGLEFLGAHVLAGGGDVQRVEPGAAEGTAGGARYRHRQHPVHAAVWRVADQARGVEFGVPQEDRKSTRLNSS